MRAELAATGWQAPRQRWVLLRLAGAEASAASFVAPALLVLVLMNVVPLLWSLGIAFFRYRADRLRTPPRFMGLYYYIDAATDPDIWERLRNTAILMFGSVAVQVAIGGLLAWMLYRPFPGRRFVLMLVLTPMLLSMVFVGTFFNFFYDPTFGFISTLLRPLIGHPITLLGTPLTSMLSLIFADAWMWAPFVMLMLLAGLQGIPAHLVEAAEIDRADGWRRFRAVIWPSLRTVLLLAILFRSIESFNQFDLVFTITNGGPGTSTETLSTTIYNDAFVTFDTGRAAALANFGTFVVIVLVRLYFAALRHRDAPA
jgi:multiple sugar transport system permease protein